MGPLTDFVSLKDLNSDQWALLLQLSDDVKRHPGHFRQMLTGRSIVLVFEKPSLRTRLTFELGMKQLGGDAVYLDYQESRLGGREALSDVARNLERWFNGIVVRTFDHGLVTTLAEYASVPVINALTDAEHPCQALADLFTLKEKWQSLEGRLMAYVGDGNNVCTSLIHAAAHSNMSFRAITPAAYRPSAGVEEDFRRLCRSPTATYEWSDSLDALEGADAIYTDTWVSMGKEGEARRRLEELRRYQVTPEMMERTGKASLFMHCLPAHRNQEVTDSVMDSPSSVVFEQAENRLHVQKALILVLLAARETERLLQLDRWAAWS